MTTPIHYYTKRQWRFLRSTTSSDKQLTSWHIFTLAFCITSDRQIPHSTDPLHNCHQHQHTPSICPPQPLPATLHHPDHESAHHHSLPYSENTPSPTPPPKRPQARKRKQPPLNPHADWDAWDGDADCRLVELKANPKLRPNWIFVARRVGYSVEQCKARWKELQDLQKAQDTKAPESAPLPTDVEKMTPPPQPLPSTPNHISPTPTSRANTPPQPSQPDFSPSPQRQPLCLHTKRLHTKICHRSRLLSERPVRAGIRNHLPTCLLAAISFDRFHPLLRRATG